MVTAEIMAKNSINESQNYLKLTPKKELKTPDFDLKQLIGFSSFPVSCFVRLR